MQEGSGLVDQLAFGNGGLGLAASEQPPGEVKEPGIEQVTGPEFVVDPAPGIPFTEEQVGALLVHLGAVTWQRPLSPVEDAYQRQQQRVCAQVRDAGALVQDRISPSPGVVGLDVLFLGEP